MSETLFDRQTEQNRQFAESINDALASDITAFRCNFKTIIRTQITGVFTSASVFRTKMLFVRRIEVKNPYYGTVLLCSQREQNS
jgi:hypothetical protein